ncbi:MAG: iron-containing alcohol dehydrogenase [Bacillota bacterium]|nr:iron-containing alcohol dehydrogenase [Bacillota bacterium]
MIYNINPTPPIMFGHGASEQVGVKVKELGCKKVLVVHGKVIKKSGIADRIISLINKEGIQTVAYDKVMPDPPASMIEEGAAFAKAEEIDSIVGVGGGSALDAAKGINVLLGNPSPIIRYFDKSIPLKPGKTMILIPTTAGTGSEANAISVVTDTDADKKSGVIGAPCVASLAIVDPGFTVGLPAELTVVTGIDAFSHGVEALTSALANPVSDILSERVISLVYNNLPAALMDPSNPEIRSNLSLAAMIAGIAFNDAPPQLGHAIAHTLGAYFHVSHGTLCAIALPEVVEYVADAVPEKVKIAGKAMGINVDEISPEDLGKVVANEIRVFTKKLGLPIMKDLNISKDELARMAPEVLHDDCGNFIPKETDPETVLNILYKTYDL